MARLNGTQSAWVRRQLLAGRKLSHADLISACGGNGGHRLAAITWRLKKKRDWPITATPIPGAGGPNPMVFYKIPNGWRPTGPMQMDLPL